MKRKINLRDPEFEPTDEELAELMRSSFAEVRARREARGDLPPPPPSEEELALRKVREREVADEITRRVRERWPAAR